jgi:hypothetical protein
LSGAKLWYVSKTCPAQNEEFCANKAKGINRRILVATFDPGGFRNLDFTRATLALAIQKKVMAYEDLDQ